MRFRNRIAVSTLIALSTALYQAPSAEAKEYKVLVLPGGGATGIIPATLLAQLEETTGRPVYQLFDEIWSASIGAAMATLLTTPRSNPEIADSDYEVSGPQITTPMSAAELVQFLEQTFSRYHRAWRIRGSLRKLIPADSKLNNTLIPIRIMSAEVQAWSKYIKPAQTTLRVFCQEENGNVSLADATCSSCTVYPIHPICEKVKLNEDKTIYCLDAGSEVCTHSSMNPLFQSIVQFSRKMQKEDTLSVFFLSNGWIRLHESWGTRGMISIPGANGNVRMNLFNVDVNINPVFQEWKNQTWTGTAVNRCTNGADYVLCNLAGAGTIPVTLLAEEGRRVAKESRVFHEMVNYLIR